MNWNLEGKRINGLYMGFIPVQGRVELSRVKYGGEVSHHMVLEEPIKVYGAVRDRVILEHKFVNRVMDHKDDEYDWALDRGQNFAAGY
jgi:hypothetical protein